MIADDLRARLPEPWTARVLLAQDHPGRPQIFIFPVGPTQTCSLSICIEDAMLQTNYGGGKRHYDLNESDSLDRFDEDLRTIGLPLAEHIP